MDWDPPAYLVFADERGRAFVELLRRVDAEAPTTVVDLGCGPGTFTELLEQRWPYAHIIGIDSSPTMIDFARSRDSHVDYVQATVHAWEPAEPVDILVSNATLQWVPHHLELLPRWARSIAPGGWLAFQVPGNFNEPTHTIRSELAADEPFHGYLRSTASASGHDAQTYLRALSDIGCAVDAWETTYLHVLRGPDPVFEWVAATSARPTLDALPEDLRTKFEEEFKARLREAYPDTGEGVVMPFRRVFVVARIPSWD